MDLLVAKLYRQAGVLLALLGCVSGCTPGGGNLYQEPPPPTVDVSVPLKHDITDYVEATGTTEPYETVEIRARVEGYLDEIYFEPGQEGIRAGDKLYLIDQKPYQAIVTEARAALTVAEASAKDAEAKYERAKLLAPKGAISQEELFERQASMEVAKAQIKAAQAQLERAELELSYTVVKSPIDGRVGMTLVDKGNLVGKSLTTHLTTVIRYDPIYATFNISEPLMLELRKLPGDREKPEDREIEFLMGIGSEEGYPYKGTLDYADLGVDSSSGTYSIRGVFPNPDLELIRGLFVRIRIPIGKRMGALLVPESAVGADQEGRYVLLVKSEEGASKVERRAVTLGAKRGGMRVVLTGLEANESVIVRGIQRVRPGINVQPEQVELELPAELQAASDASSDAPPSSGQTPSVADDTSAS